MGKILSIVAVVLFGAVFVWDYARRRRHSPEKEKAEREAMEKQILSPDWTFYERHLQRPVPSVLRELFADRELVTSCDLKFSKGIGISTFNPLNEDNLIETSGELGFDVVPFATSDCGDAVFLRPGTDQPDAVYIAYHDDPEKGIVVLADSVAEMLEKLRKMSDVA